MKGTGFLVAPNGARVQVNNIDEVARLVYGWSLAPVAAEIASRSALLALFPDPAEDK
jgi:hypothetical protein